MTQDTPTEIGWPLQHNRIRRGLVNHTFGMVRRNVDGSRRPHQGWDFEAEAGTPCFAIADGTIELLRDAGAYGRQIVLAFDFDFDGDGYTERLYAVYCHLQRFDVVQGQQVKRGDQIGLTGNTGNAVSMRGPDQHLHFEVRTMLYPDPGLADRYSPLVLFRQCPLGAPVMGGVA